ncbi:RNA-directed DNA polymerase, eukaryota, reverse transcriptase zinc-binding domain protein [Tanacetum coccineum]
MTLSSVCESDVLLLLFRLEQSLINILLTQELLKGYNCINGPRRCAFKIDIQKAYDTVSWEFIKDIMSRFGFPCKMIDWIMTCISTPKFTICVNGERYGYFKGGRGLRQGDPIFPYIFTMVMKMLNLIVKNEIRKNNTFKYHFGCRQLKINHLCFADDLIMFSHGDKVFVTILRNALNKFSVMSSLYPNLGKCTMFCGSLNEDDKIEISSIIPFKEDELPVRYLGVHLVTKKIGVTDCRVRQKLSDWKNKALSYAGRAQLIASVLGSMQVYWCYVFLLPKAVMNDIEKLFKNFFWNNGDNYKGDFYAGFKDRDKLIGVLGDNGWKWPQQWFIKYPWLANIQVPILSNHKDKAIWVDNNGSEKRFTTNIVWKDVRGSSGKVSCMCNKEPDSHEHLFFKCKYAQYIWKKICDMAKLRLKEDKWGKILERDENKRLFNSCRRDEDDLFKIICEELKAKMVSITVKNNANIIQAETIWNVKFANKLSLIQEEN